MPSWRFEASERNTVSRAGSWKPRWATYEELRRLASSVRRSDPNASLSPTTLVNEAWLKLRHSPRLAGLSHLHFKRTAARAMRQVLIEGARRSAELLGVSEATVLRDWRAAKAWLAHQLRQAS